MLWQVLVQFVFRLAFGLALAMGLTPPRLVTSGFYRVHLWVLLGLNTFAAAVIYLLRDQFSQPYLLLALVVGAAVGSYLGAVFWLYERSRPGMLLLWGVALIDAVAAVIGLERSVGLSVAWPLWILDVLSAGLLIGSTFAAMLLGHWYLNTPTMQLTPLKRLIALMAIAVTIRGLLCGGGLIWWLGDPQAAGQVYGGFLALRWLAGLVGILVLAWMSWQTLKIPNTQSATGILYVGVIFVFLGELTAQLMAVGTPYPL